MRKAIIVVVGCIFLSLVAVLTLMFTGVLPNVFLDRSDLVCSRIYIENDQMKQEDYVEITFDNLAITNKGTEINEIVYYDESILQQSYDELKKIEQYGSVVELKNNVIIISSSIEINKEDKVKREIMKERYEEYGYACK